jgi:hypothetical protein
MVDPKWDATRGLASELARQNDTETVAAIFEPPAVGCRKALTVALAEVVGVRVGAVGEVINPHGGCGVLIGQGHGG